jgi:hypothetical protein
LCIVRLKGENGRSVEVLNVSSNCRHEKDFVIVRISDSNDERTEDCGGEHFLCLRKPKKPTNSDAMRTKRTNSDLVLFLREDTSRFNIYDYYLPPIKRERTKVISRREVDLGLF